MPTYFSSAYWPNLYYFYHLLKADSILVEACEHYQKQSFRNRTQILSANGKLDLSVPVIYKQNKEPIKDIEISYRDNWQLKHWGAIISAYRNSPYFEYFEQDLKEFYFKRFELLLDYNTKQVQFIFKILKVNKEIHLTSDYERSPLNVLDLRESIHPKKKIVHLPEVNKVLSAKYYQTFSSKFDFVPNLSILDLVFNIGLGARDYLNF